jgi:hypothetical protein
MTYPFIFANLSGNQPASDLDTMFGIAGQQGNIPCTATGTNAIVLVAQTNCYSPAAYTDKQLVSWTAAGTSTGAVTMSAFGLGTLNYYDATGVQSTSGSIQNGVHYLSQYCSELNSGAGGFITLNTTGTAAVNTPVPVMGSFKNLLITNTTATTAASQINVSFDEAVLENSSGGTVKVGSGFSGSGGVSFTINANTSGAANGLDTGTFGVGTYYIWAIYNPTTTTTAGLLSLSSTVPLLPAGYSYKGRAGACIAVTGPKFVNWMQRGKISQNLVGTYNSNALSGLPIMAGPSGAAGSISIPTWVAVTLVNFVPTTATAVRVLASCLSTSNSGIIIAPNLNYGAYNSTTNPPPIVLVCTSGTVFLNTITSIIIENPLATGLYWASNVTNGSVWCLGWEDNVNA